MKGSAQLLGFGKGASFTEMYDRVCAYVPVHIPPNVQGPACMHACSNEWWCIQLLIQFTLYGHLHTPSVPTTTATCTLTHSCNEDSCFDLHSFSNIHSTTSYPRIKRTWDILGNTWYSTGFGFATVQLFFIALRILIRAQLVCSSCRNLSQRCQAAPRVLENRCDWSKKVLYRFQSRNWRWNSDRISWEKCWRLQKSLEIQCQINSI